ncbi:MAG TPA: beta-glucosidase [Natronincola sp.]|nr:beta-glucosidase [Natronincola sp.]
MKHFLEELARYFGFEKAYASELEQQLDTVRDSGEIAVKTVTPLARATAAEGIVLLKNDNSTLPINEKDKVAVFGRTALNYFGVGYGSGGDVRRPYLINLIDGLLNSGVQINQELNDVYQSWTDKPENLPEDGSWDSWGKWPMSFPEMPLTEAVVKKAAEQSDLALVVIGRAAGEDRENKLEEGSYYLTDVEKDMLKQVTTHFQRVAVVLNSGNLIDLSWIKDYEDKLGALVLAWQGGMESGNAVADVLTGAVNPSGKLTAAVSDSYESLPSAKHFGDKDYNNYVEDIYVGYRYFETFAPEKVLFPFGYGLSYTSFSIESDYELSGTEVNLNVSVKNTGETAGKEVVQVYLASPQGLLGKPAKVLVAFDKTKKLEPGETQSLEIKFDLASFASYDDSGITGHKSAYVLEAGQYSIYLGTDSRENKLVFQHNLPETLVVQQLSEVMAVEPDHAFDRLVNKNGEPVYEKVPVKTTDLKEIILSELPAEIPYSGDQGIKLGDVLKGNNTLEEFVSQLSPEELDDISHGEGPMNSPFGAPGNAGALGGITEALRDRGIPPVITADGPSGIRILRTCSLLPNGTALASTFNLDLVTELYAELGAEVVYHGVDILLAPGMNIHRNPLCGRNFEYFSEDPLVTGKMAAAVINGLQRNGVAACPKHFACNNQETNRNRNDSRVSERALREIYLKPFEIAIEESNPLTIMTSYNKVNAVWSHYSYELVTTILRNEWGYDGLILTDWWMQASPSPEFPNLINDAYRVRAQVDVLMPGGDVHDHKVKVGRHLLDTYGEPDGITLGEMQRIALNVLRFILKCESTKKKIEK